MFGLPTTRAHAAARRSQGCRLPHGARGARGALALGVACLAASGIGCGPGFTVRAHRGTSHVATGGIAGAGTRAGGRQSAASAYHREDERGALAGAAAAEGVSVDPDADEAEAPSSNASTTPTATKYAAMDRGTCEAELGRRGIAFERVDEARGVIAPLRVTGAIAGVEFHSMLPFAQRKTSPYEIYDCRLVLALDDWARVLSRHDVVEVVHYSVYRPPPAKQVLTGPGRRHGGALAIDAAMFKTRDGQVLNVEKDFHGRIGGKPCASLAASALPPRAVTLRKLVCEAAEAQLFNVLLTPDYNWPHRNHFHLEVTVGARWVLVR